MSLGKNIHRFRLTNTQKILPSFCILDKSKQIHVFQMLFNKYVEKSNSVADFEMDIRKNQDILLPFM